MEEGSPHVVLMVQEEVWWLSSSALQRQGAVELASVAARVEQMLHFLQGRVVLFWGWQGMQMQVLWECFLCDVPQESVLPLTRGELQFLSKWVWSFVLRRWVLFVVSPKKEVAQLLQVLSLLPEAMEGQELRLWESVRLPAVHPALRILQIATYRVCALRL